MVTVHWDVEHQHCFERGSFVHAGTGESSYPILKEAVNLQKAFQFQFVQHVTDLTRDTFDLHPNFTI